MDRRESDLRLKRQGGDRHSQRVEAHAELILSELIAATDWLPHTTRAAPTGLRKRGYAVTIDRSDKELGSTYRARSDETLDVEQARSQCDDLATISATPKLKNARRAEKPQAQQTA